MRATYLSSEPANINISFADPGGRSISGIAGFNLANGIEVLRLCLLSVVYAGRSSYKVS